MSWLGPLFAALFSGVQTWWTSRKTAPEPDPVKPPGFDAADARIQADLAAREAPTAKTPRETTAPASSKSNPY